MTQEKHELERDGFSGGYKILSAAMTTIRSR
jgi:hypothetical protein